MDIVLGFDIGATNTRMTARNTDGEMVGGAASLTDGQHYAQSLRAQLLAARELTAGHHVLAVGVGIAAAIDDGVVGGSGGLPDWEGHRYWRYLASRFKCPVVVMNDCAAAAIGEYSVLQSPFIYLGWGSGVGVTVVEHGQTQPTELGHMTIERGSAAQCGCGGIGHLEAFTGGNYLTGRFDCEVEAMTDKQWSQVLRDMAVGLGNISAGYVGKLPIVMGGGVICKQAHRLPELQALVDELVGACKPPKLQLAHHAEDSALEGAVYAAFQLLR